MINFVRRSKDPYSWSYHNDLMAAFGPHLSYHVSLGVGAELKHFLDKFYTDAPKQFAPIYFLSASETESQLPMIGLITHDVGMLRVLEHPLAKEFVGFIPWVYRESFISLQRLVNHMDATKTLPEIYKNIEDIRWVNHKLARRSMLEEIIQQLSLIKLSQFWEATPTEMSLQNWLSQITHNIHKVNRGEYKSIKLPLPCNENYYIPGIIFWLQLLESVLGHRYTHWKAYWCEESLLFIKGAHTMAEVMGLFDAEPRVTVDSVQSVMIPKDMDITLIKLLSCWGEVVKSREFN